MIGIIFDINTIRDLAQGIQQLVVKLVISLGIDIMDILYYYYYYYYIYTLL